MRARAPCTTSTTVCSCFPQERVSGRPRPFVFQVCIYPCGRSQSRLHNFVCARVVLVGVSSFLENWICCGDVSNCRMRKRFTALHGHLSHSRTRGALWLCVKEQFPGDATCRRDDRSVAHPADAIACESAECAANVTLLSIVHD